MGRCGAAVGRWLDEHDGRPGEQLRFETAARLPLADFPTPAYRLIRLRQYFISSIQFSSGCPYTCDFCDIPALYGRAPRLKTAAQVLAELDELVAGGAGAAAPPGGLAGPQSVPAALRLRGDAEHRAARGRARPDARRGLPGRVLRHRDPARFAHNFAHTFARRPAFPLSPQRASWRNAATGVALLARIVWQVGIRGGYCRTFWRLAGPALRRGQVEELVQAAVVSHHLIEFTRRSLAGAGGAAFYAPGG